MALTGGPASLFMGFLPQDDGTHLPARSHGLAAVAYLKCWAHRKHSNVSSEEKDCDCNFRLPTAGSGGPDEEGQASAQPLSLIPRASPFAEAKEGSVLEVQARLTQHRTRGTTASGRWQSCRNIQ